MNFENILNKIRNILRLEGITGMNSINHCIIFITAKILTKEVCDKLKMPNYCIFHNILYDEDNLKDSSNIMKDFYRKGKQHGVVYHICNILKFNTFKFKIKTPLNLRNILLILEKVNIDELNQSCDLVGYIYELHLKTGTSSAMRDLGQYFTNRSVIKYMIKLTDPKIINGQIETLLDPTMGTGGFLTMAIKFLNQKYEDIDWSKQKDYIYGFDIDENVKNMSFINLFLETTEKFSNIIQQDTLYNGLKINSDNILDKVDIIIANEPMGLKGVKYKLCCDKIKNLKIRGTKAEPLFLQLMMESLNENGRCAVVVPDGFLFTDAKLHLNTRKHLVENFNLKEIIMLNDKNFFLNTNVQTSILFFEKKGKTENVIFKQLKLNNLDVKDEVLKIVNIKDIVKTGYSLFIDDYLINQNIRFKVDYISLKKLCIFETSKYNSGFMDNNGEYDFYNGKAKNPDGKHSTYNFNYPEYIAIIKGGGAGRHKYGKQIGLGKTFYLQGKNACSNGLYILTLNEKYKKKVLLKYLHYYFTIHKNRIMDMARYTTGLGNIKISTIQRLEIPIPNISVQQQIINNFDKINNEIAKLTAQIKVKENFKEIIIHNELETKYGLDEKVEKEEFVITDEDEEENEEEVHEEEEIIICDEISNPTTNTTYIYNKIILSKSS